MRGRHLLKTSGSTNNGRPTPIYIKSKKMKQTQNQYFGKKSDMPARANQGTSYITTDTEYPELYIYGEELTPSRISTQVAPVNYTTIERNLIVPFLGQVIHNTDIGENEYWSGSSWVGEGVNMSNDLDNRIIVTQANKDATIGGVIDSTKEYYLDGIIDMESTQITIPSTGITITGASFDISGLTSSEDNYIMFISASVGGDGNGSGNILGKDYHVSVSGANSKVYELYDDTGFNAFEFLRVNYIGCTSLGDIYNYRQGLEDGTGRFGGQPTLTMHGLWRGGYRITTSIVRGLSASMTTPLFKEGTLFQMNSRFLTDMNVDLPALASIMDFDPTHFPNASTIQLQGMEVTRDGIYNSEDLNLTPNLKPGDLACYWKGNNGLSNTFVGGTALVVTEVETTISVSGDYYPLEGVWLDRDMQHFEMTPANGGLKHLGNTPKEFEISLNLNIDGGPNDDLSIKAFKYDASEDVEIELDYTLQRRTVNNFTGGRDVAFFMVQTGVTLDTDDVLYWRVANDTDTQNVTVEELSFILIKER